MRLLSFEESIEYTIVGGELAVVFVELKNLPLSQQVQGVPIYDRWRKLALRYNEISGAWNRCPHCGGELER